MPRIGAVDEVVGFDLVDVAVSIALSAAVNAL